MSTDEPRARFDAPLFGQPSRAIPQYSPYPNTGRKIPWAIIGVVAAALVLAVAGLSFLGPQLNAEPLSLGVIEQNGQLQIQWNHASRASWTRPAGRWKSSTARTSAAFPMNRSELAQGSFTYTRKSGDVQVRLTVNSSGGQPYGRGVAVPGRGSGSGADDATRRTHSRWSAMRCRTKSRACAGNPGSRRRASSNWSGRW